MLDLITDLFSSSSDTQVNDNLEQELLEILRDSNVSTNLEKLLSEEYDWCDQKTTKTILICELFSYRLVVRSNDIPISTSVLEAIYDSLAQKLRPVTDVAQVKKRVNQLITSYKSCAQERKKAQVEAAVDLLVDDIYKQQRESEQFKSDLQETVFRYITIIQDFFTSKTSNL